MPFQKHDLVVRTSRNLTKKIDWKPRESSITKNLSLIEEIFNKTSRYGNDLQQITLSTFN